MELSNDYNYPISNYYGNLSYSFKEYKSELIIILRDMDDIAKEIKKIIETDDPVYAENIYETELDEKYDSLSSSKQKLYNEDFFNACRLYKKKFDFLKEKNLFDKHCNFYDMLKEKVIPALLGILPPEEDKNILIELVDINNLLESEVIVTKYEGKGHDYDSIPNKAVISLTAYNKKYDNEENIKLNINEILFPIIRKIDKIIFPDM
jgi:hypothetical protein